MEKETDSHILNLLLKIPVIQLLVTHPKDFHPTNHNQTPVKCQL